MKELELIAVMAIGKLPRVNTYGIFTAMLRASPIPMRI